MLEHQWNHTGWTKDMGAMTWNDYSSLGLGMTRRNGARRGYLQDGSQGATTAMQFNVEPQLDVPTQWRARVRQYLEEW